MDIMHRHTITEDENRVMKHPVAIHVQVWSTLQGDPNVSMSFSDGFFVALFIYFFLLVELRKLIRRPDGVLHILRN